MRNLSIEIRNKCNTLPDSIETAVEASADIEEVKEEL